MSPFFLARRLIILAWLALSVLCGLQLESRFGLYEQSKAVLAHLRRDYQILINYREDQKKLVGELDGEVVKIVDSSTLQIRNSAGVEYNIRLAGIEPVPTDYSSKNPKGLDRGMGEVLDPKTYLERQALGRSVHVDLVYLSPYKAGVGMVALNEADLSVSMVEVGLATPSPNAMKALPTRLRFELELAFKSAEARER